MQIEVINEFALVKDGKRIPISSARLSAILLVLALRKQTRIRRDYLISVLWSQSDETRARGSLRNLLFNQRKYLPQGFDAIVQGNRSEVFVDADGLATDLDILRERLAEKDFKALSAYYFADLENALFPQFYNLDPEFDELLRYETHQIIENLRKHLLHALATASEESDQQIIAQKLIELAPYDELAYRKLMDMEARRGNVAGAMSYYERLWNLLDQELDVEPSKETQDLFVQIKQETFAKAGADQNAHGEPNALFDSKYHQTLIVVRPFQIEAGADQAAAVCGAMRSEIIDALCRVPEWVVLDLDSSVPVSLEGRVYEFSGNLVTTLGRQRLIMNAKLLSSQNRIVWNDAIFLDDQTHPHFGEKLAIGMAATITGRIHDHLFHEINNSGLSDVSDYDRLLMAKKYCYEWDYFADRKAEEIFRSLTRVPALSSRANIGIAELINGRQLVFPGLDTSQAEREEAIVLAKTAATESNDYRAEANLCLAWSYIMNGQHKQAMGPAKYAANAFLSHPRNLASSIECLALSGAIADAKYFDEVASQLYFNLSSTNIAYRVTLPLLMGDYERALQRASRASDKFLLPPLYGAIAALKLGDEAPARELFASFHARIEQAWAAEGGPSNQEISQWFHSTCPISQRDIEQNFGAEIEALFGAPRQKAAQN